MTAVTHFRYYNQRHGGPVSKAAHVVLTEDVRKTMAASGLTRKGCAEEKRDGLEGYKN